MALKASYEFMFTGKDDNSFLENYAYDLYEQHGDKSGQVFINLEVQNNPVDAEEIGGAIYETMQKVFFEEIDREPYERFEIALKAVNNVILEFKEQKTSGYIGNLNVIIAAIVGDDLFVTQTGDAEAYLVRKRYVTLVSEGLDEGEGEEGEVFFNIASGKVEAGDFVLFSSTRLLRYISKTDLSKCLGRKEVDEALAEVRDVIATEILGRVGVTGMYFEKATNAEEHAVVDGEDTSTQTLLESGEGNSVVEKETVTGRFLTALKRYRRGKTAVVGGGSRMGDKAGDLFKGLFSKGFGKDKILALLVFVILVLVVGVVVARGNLKNREELERLDGILVSVQERVADAETKGSYDKESAKDILDKAYEDAMTVLNSDYYRDKAISQLNKIEQVRDKLDNVQRVEDPTVLVDLSEKRSDINALGFALVGDRVFAYEYNALYEIVLDQVQDPLTIDDAETVIAATGFDDRSSVVFLTKSGKLIEYKNGTMSFMDTDDGQFHRGVALADWSNRIYILDPEGSQIWRYDYKGTRDKFGTATAYVGDDTDLSASKDFAIDASVYTLQENGDVYKFYAGNKAEFYINNAPFNAFKNPSVIYTNEKLDDVYVLDSSEGRVLSFKKDSKTGNLVYESQYLFEGVGELRDLYVDPDSRKMYILTESKVLEVSL